MKKVQSPTLKLKTRQKRRLMIKWVKRHWRNAITVVYTVVTHTREKTFRMLVGVANKKYLVGLVDGAIAILEWSKIKVKEAATDDGFKFDHVAAL
ncbi:MAG: hypothetical protein V4697_02100 [Patescibacteria group bacterium]